MATAVFVASMLLWLCLFALSLLVPIPRLGVWVLDRIRWRRLPRVGHLGGIAASGLLLGASCASFITAAAVNPYPASTTASPRNASATAAPQSSGSTTNPLGGLLVLGLIVGAAAWRSRQQGGASTGAYHPTTVANIEALYEPGEATVAMTDWLRIQPRQSATWDPSRGRWTARGLKLAPSSATLALTRDHIYVVVSGQHGVAGRGKRKVTWFDSVPLSSLSSWSFDKTKTTTGILKGHSFSFSSSKKGWQDSGGAVWWLAPTAAEPFAEAFTGAIARFATTAAPIDLAAQLRALQGLVDDGVLTADDMQRAKDLFLGRAPDQRQAMERSLRSLFELKRAGVLNAVEFEIKKRDLLATTK